MNRMMPLLGAVCIGLVGTARAEHKDKAFAKNTPVVVVGVVTSEPKSVTGEKKMQVGVGPEKHDYTLHLRGAKLFAMGGQKVDEDHFDEGMWVRAEGKVMDDPRRVQVMRLQVIGKDHPAFERSAFYHSSMGTGYVTAVAGSRETLTPFGPRGAMPFVVVGKVSDDTGTFNSTRRVQVDAAGNTWTLSVPKDALIRDTRDKEISVHEIHDGQWVRAHGWRTGDLRMRVERLENIGRNEVFQTSTFFRRDFPLGYVDPIAGDEAFTLYNLSGTVTRIDPAFGAVHIRDDKGAERVIYTDSVTITRGGEQIGMDQVRVDDSVTIEGRTLRFK